MAAPVAAKAATIILKDKRLRKAVLTVILVIIGIIIVPIYMFTSVTSGSFSLFAESPEKIKANYLALRDCLSETFSGLRITVSREVRERAEEFMPDFTLNVTKARLETAVTSGYPPIYTPEDIQFVDSLIAEISNNIKERYHLFEEDPEAYFYIGDVRIIIATFYYDEEFNNGNDFRKYRQSSKSKLLAVVGQKMQSHTFTSRKTDGARIETLTVKSEDGIKEVELITVGRNGLYIPEFLAMFQLKQTMETMALTGDKSAAARLESDIVTVFNSFDYSGAGIIPVIFKSNSGKGNSLDFLDKNALYRILERSIDNGFIRAGIAQAGNKLTITINVPTAEEWCEIFEIPPEYRRYADEYLIAINVALNQAGITESEKYLSLDEIFNFSPFSYFSGLFALPTEFSGIASAYGQDGVFHDIYIGSHFQDLHEYSMTINIGIAFEKLNLTLPPENGCVLDVKVLETKQELKTDRQSNAFDDGTVSIMYVIDSELFERNYGFPLSSITGSGKKEQTVILSYGCLESLSSFAPEASLYDFAEPIPLGVSHENHLKISMQCEDNGKFLDPRLLLQFDAEVKGLSPIRPINYRADFIWAVDERFTLITTYFGYDPWRDGMHYGIDIGNAGINSANIYAVKDGIVVRALNDGDWNGGYGNYLIIEHSDGISTLYAHADSVIVKEGATVRRGDIIAYVGNTGWSTAPHLHFEARVNGIPVNPFGFYNKD
ncbi:MAG: M23 family metallopeptidase [Oscillospiraceae bacterium]|nr:M23 family metallopeptidase [Oscillospiraceae bacterium]